MSKSKKKSAARMTAARSISTQTLTQEKDYSKKKEHTSKKREVKEAHKKPHVSTSFFSHQNIPSPFTTFGVILIGLCTAFYCHIEAKNTIVAIEAHSTHIASQTQIAVIKNEEDAIPEENSLYIPKLNVFTKVTEGEHEDKKKYNLAWRRTHTSTPEKGGNTVIVGHRYRDNSPNYPLYNIDQITENDEIIVLWDGEKYTYKVDETLEVHETAIEIEDNTDKDMLTLYACDWTGKRRLVVQASLQNSES